MESMDSDVRAFARLHRFAVLIAVVVFAGMLAAALGIGNAVGAAKIAVLGAAAPANPSCPEDPCQAIVKTTGFQTAIGANKSPFAAPYPGRIVAWSIKLSSPSTTRKQGQSESQMEFFNKFADGPPQARLSVLKPIRKKIKAGKQIYKLKSQSPIEELSPFLGTTTTFTLQSPLKINTGQIAALTVPTWAPAFALGQGKETGWRASRVRTACGTTKNPTDAESQIKAGTPHEAVGTQRAYGCPYNTARLLYSATIVGAPTPAPPPKKK
jgi:hypothetical protein